MTNFGYLAVAYGALWLLHMIYSLTLGSRQKQIREEIELLTERAKRGPA